MVYDHFHFIEFAVVNSCQPPLILMNNCFTAYSILDQLIVYTLFYVLLRTLFREKCGSERMILNA